jgi:hypothetical protein
MDDWNERTDLGVQETTSKKTEMERLGLWFAAYTPSQTEFGKYRDLVLLNKMVMTPNLEAKNDKLFAPNTLWFTGQISPTWEPIRGRSEDEVWLYLRIQKDSILFPEDKSLLPVDPRLFLKAPEKFPYGVTENDILYQDELQTFDESLSVEDAEKLACILSAGFLKLPLLLQFFAENRIGTLLNLDTRCVLESCFFAPGRYDKDQIYLPQIPCDTGLGTSFGRLAAEMVFCPDSVFKPLLSLLRESEKMCFHGFKSVFVNLYLFLIRLAVRVLKYRFWVESNMEGAFPSVLLASILRYLKGSGKDLIEGWFQEASSEKDQDSVIQFQTHLSFLYHFEKDLPAFLKATTNVILWHGKQNVTETQKHSLNAPHYLNSVPIHDVFANYHQNRTDLLKWIKEQNSENLEPLLQSVSDIGIGQLTSPVTSGWEKIETKPPMCYTTVESGHPYRGPVRMYYSVSFPGADHLSIRFDSLSKIGTTDYVTIYQDNTYTTTWGPAKIQNNWPGASGRPPLVIPTDHFVVFFYADVTTLPDWGFKLIAEAPVCLQSVEVLFNEFEKSHGVTRHMCQHALAACNNHLDLSRDYLKENHEKLKSDVVAEAKAEKSADTVEGLWSKTCPTGTIHVNLQTAEVYYGNRLSMPVPMEIASHNDFKTVFKGNVPYCTVKETKQHLKTLQVENEEYLFHISAWTPLKFLSHEEEAVLKIDEKEKAENEKLQDTKDKKEKESVAPYINAPVIQKTEGGYDLLNHRGFEWNLYQKGDLGLYSSKPRFSKKLAE